MNILIVLLASIAISGCALIEGAPMLTHVMVKEWDESKLIAQGVSEEDLENLKSGRLEIIRARYESLATLSSAQHRLLCDIYIKQLDNQSEQCLAQLEQRLFQNSLFNQPGGHRLRSDLARGDLSVLAKDRLGEYFTAQPYALADAQELMLDTQDANAQVVKASEYLSEHEVELRILLGKRALLQLQQGDYALAVQTSRMLDNYAGRYIHALALLNTGQREAALEIADWLAEYYETEQVYLAANLYLAAGEYQKSLTLARNKARRLALDYGLSNDKTLFGGDVSPADFRFDLFDEFRFGLLDFYSYAPRANAYVEFIVAKSQYELGEHQAAAQNYDLILAAEGVENYRDIYWLSLFDRGRIAEKMQQLPQAEEYYRRAIDVIEAYRTAARTDVGRMGLIGDPQQVYGQLVELLVAQNRGMQALSVVERARSRETVDWASSIDSFAQTSDSDSDAMRRFMQAEKALLSGALAGDPEALRRTRSAHIAAREEIRASPAKFKHLVTVDQPNFDDMKLRVAQDETIVTYYFHNNSLYAFILNYGAQDLKIVRIDAAYSEIEKAVENLRTKISDVNSRDYLQSAGQLYDWLLKPLQPWLTGSRLTFSVNGGLLLLPYGVLFDGNHHLIEKYRLSVLPNINLVNELRNKVSPKGDILIVGNPDRGPDYDLPHAQLEASLISDTWRRGKSTTQTGYQATLENFEQSAGKNQFIHLAAHAVFDRRQPMNSHILLAQPQNNVSHDGKLHASQLLSESRYRIDANLVVLSGCETSVSSDKEQLSGLAVSFLYAGANSVVGSLWTVDDRATAFLMERFYNRLSKGFVVESALQNAQISTLQQFPHPYYWAAFQFTGHSQGAKL